MIKEAALFLLMMHQPSLGEINEQVIMLPAPSPEKPERDIDDIPVIIQED